MQAARNEVREEAGFLAPPPFFLLASFSRQPLKCLHFCFAFFCLLLACSFFFFFFDLLCTPQLYLFLFCFAFFASPFSFLLRLFCFAFFASPFLLCLFCFAFVPSSAGCLHFASHFCFAFFASPSSPQVLVACIFASPFPFFLRCLFASPFSCRLFSCLRVNSLHTPNSCLLLAGLLRGFAVFGAKPAFSRVWLSLSAKAKGNPLFCFASSRVWRETRFFLVLSRLSLFCFAFVFSFFPRLGFRLAFAWLSR